MGVTLPVDGSKEHLHIKGFKPEEVAIGDCAKDLRITVPLAHEEIYRESHIPGGDSFLSRIHLEMRGLYRYICGGQWLGDAEEGLYSSGGGAWQKAEVRINFFRKHIEFFLAPC